MNGIHEVAGRSRPGHQPSPDSREGCLAGREGGPIFLTARATVGKPTFTSQLKVVHRSCAAAKVDGWQANLRSDLRRRALHPAQRAHITITRWLQEQNPPYSLRLAAQELRSIHNFPHSSAVDDRRLICSSVISGPAQAHCLHSQK